jgi:hypothetical protein
MDLGYLPRRGASILARLAARDTLWQLSMTRETARIDERI